MRSLLATLLILPALFAPAVETSPLPVISVSDGDTITVRGDLGGLPLPVKVRLLYLDTPESRDNAHGAGMVEGKQAGEALRTSVPAGAQVVLWGPGDQLKPDTYGRILAVVYRLDGDARVSVNAEMVRGGWSPYWRKYGDAPEPVHAELLAAQAAAKDAKVGAWGTAEKYMRDKSNERTAPKSKKDRAAGGKAAD